MAKMRAAQYDVYGSPDVLQIRDLDRPELQPGHALVRVTATSINGADVAIRSGRLRWISGRSFPRGTGFDFSGEVVAVSGKNDIREGDAVWGMNPDIKQPISAAAAEYYLAPLKGLARLPKSLDPLEAAALPGAGGAALGILRDAARLLPGERVLIRGASGGVGVFAVQIAKAMGAHVTAMVKSHRLERARGLGADDAFDYGATDPRALGNFDVIVDPVGRSMSPYRSLLGKGGRMIDMAIGGPGDIAYLLFSNVFGARRVRFVSSPPDRERLEALAEYVETRGIRPVIDSTYSLDNIGAAHQSLEKSGGWGQKSGARSVVGGLTSSVR